MSQWETIKEECPLLYKNGIVFECGIGWYDVIHDLSLKIEKILNENPEYFEMCAVQVREKYGTLRFYMGCETDEISELISDAEALSSQTCECCGDVGKMRGTYWSEVRCDKCYEEEK